jgi:hypothetical protein
MGHAGGRGGHDRCHLVAMGIMGCKKSSTMYEEPWLYADRPLAWTSLLQLAGEVARGGGGGSEIT